VNDVLGSRFNISQSFRDRSQTQHVFHLDLVQLWLWSPIKDKVKTDNVSCIYLRLYKCVIQSGASPCRVSAR